MTIYSVTSHISDRGRFENTGERRRASHTVNSTPVLVQRESLTTNCCADAPLPQAAGCAARKYSATSACPLRRAAAWQSTRFSGAAMFVRVPQHLDMPSQSSHVADISVPRAAARVEPHQRMQVPLPSSSTARPRVELALPVVDQLLEHAHAADGRSEAEHAPIE
eukprot:CAMPEP_0179849464 /NCGR_PEP_ID=MMETSP0982-20121206/7174_1 /TAXON_ID=483367 /ORGANISM="non described non described, Strain CCMP 2436" /LENGTH=164 /DNA_ID=CAMNT_0021734805 /DNA_START=47 /DNA_END=540 /DNA_ORIENTATION=-